MIALFLHRKNKDITLDDFKNIWRMEYFHRMWGRMIGAVFYVPAGIMWYRGYFCNVMKRRVVILGSLLAFQVSLKITILTNVL